MKSYLKVDLIPHSFQAIREWLMLEARTNRRLAVSSESNGTSLDKKTDRQVTSFSHMLALALNSHQRMCAEWFGRLVYVLMLLTVPVVLQSALFDDERSLSLWRGVIGYSPFVTLLMATSRQPHRIHHISG